MAVDYSNLWKLLIDKHMNKTQLREAAKLSTNAIAKLGRNESVSLGTLEKICISLSCKIEDIVTFIPPKQSKCEQYRKWKIIWIT